MSVLSFPERGKWGRSGYRGNCSGFVYQHLFRLLTPRTFVDPMVGGGTSVEVARELGIEALGLDLHSGFNILRERVRDRLPAHWGGGAELIVSHLPYWDMVTYSGEVYGTPHPDDLSRCGSVEEFLEKAAQGILNQREATREGGNYGFILGDLRRKGDYHALASDLQAYLPRRERRAVLIKAQHNTTSARTDYGRLKYGRVEHEYIVMYERLSGETYFVLACTAQQQQRVAGGTWRAIIRHVISGLPARFTNRDVYGAVMDAAPERVRASEHWQAKVRQTLQGLDGVQGEGAGVWVRAA